MGSWAGLAPQFTWRPSQAHLLELCEHVDDERWHLCAPPGASKTLIGLELARRLDRPTLVLSPTTAIRDQWCEAVSMFGAPGGFATSDPATTAPVLSVTYQLFGNPGSATAELRAAARRLWVSELAADHGPDVAEARVAATEEQDPRRAVSELRRHVRALRRSLATGEDVGVPVVDIVCARSDAKATGAATIVADELRRRGRSSRALVVVERDRAGTPPAEARSVLGEDAGTSTRMLAALCGEPSVVAAGVLAVTGSGAWCDAVHADAVAASMSVSAPATETGAVVRSIDCDVAGAVALTVDGASWRTAQWLAAAEATLDDGTAQVLVATRGLVGEGWDHAPIDVLVDCSEVASPTATTQLRGRALRLHPGDPDKVAALWDVAVVHPGAPGDWQRLRRRHEHWWGPDSEGTVRTGAAKVHPRLDIAVQPAEHALEAINARSAALASDHERTRRAWATVDPGGIATTALTVRTQRPRRRVRTRASGWRWSALAGTASGASSLVAAAIALSAPALWPVAAAGAGAAAALGLRATGRRRDDIDTLQVLGEAVVAGLTATGTPGLAAAQVRAAPDPAGGISVVITGVDDDVAGVWSDALAESLGPLGTPRWLVATDEQAWRVPGVVGATRDAAVSFTAAVRARVPGARLHRAGTPGATAVVLREANRRADDVDRSLRWTGRRH